jgi:hypothetical protein
VQFPATQVWSAPQTVKQAPQLLASACRSAHWSQQVWSTEQQTGPHLAWFALHRHWLRPARLQRVPAPQQSPLTTHVPPSFAHLGGTGPGPGSGRGGVCVVRRLPSAATCWYTAATRAKATPSTARRSGMAEGCVVTCSLSCERSIEAPFFASADAVGHQGRRQPSPMKQTAPGRQHWPSQHSDPGPQ